MDTANHLKVGVAQISPVWLNKELTRNKILNYIEKAGSENCDLVVFPEALLPGYPFWVGLTGGAKFNSPVQKEIHAHYIRNAVQIEEGDLDPLCEAARKNKVAVYVGTIERASNRGGHSLYCSLVYIDKKGRICSVHRKLQPTYEERLVWSQGDGNGLRVHSLGAFTVGGLNCWENWLPMARAALHGMGEDLHIAVWPGSKRNTEDITPFLAKEGRSFVISAGSPMGPELIPEDVPHRELMINNSNGEFCDGGSCIAGPDGKWILEPVTGKEGLFTAELDFNRVLEERQNLDISGHYSRPDVLNLKVNRKRQATIRIKD